MKKIILALAAVSMLSGCAVGGRLPSSTMVVEDRELVFNLVEVSKDSYRVSVRASGMVLAPDRDFEGTLYSRGAARVIHRVCNGRKAIVDAVAPPEARRYSVVVRFTCVSAPAQRKRKSKPKGFEIKA